MSTTDPLVPVLAGVIADLLRFLDECEDDEVADDTAVKLLENASWELSRLPEAQRDRLAAVFADLATAEPDPGRRTALAEFPYNCGLLEDPPA
ncbi:hypothetical protein HUT16_30830 [Kitasatospora sp. NA04385]|uniref:hypothetical protein n=1 Tax=Kitasatospora sp. NA04385 TaxID=2742135 RepID=UPI00158FC606|nr:hypothetical protein [Kitasatospora sp. NA04385]QKW22900.1 hypothetical protein HUT16_30830 [Kitasatospora sp. NA04385]